ncbi:MAG: peptidoglycan editing factor PgeF [Nitrospiraceae bacterium]|nr:peptidoglycan editing factor PgeF [Nitrospiraceae bacterium]
MYNSPDILIFPDIYDSNIRAFFSGKKPGADLDRIAEISSFKKENIYMPIQKHTDKVLLLDFDFSPAIADAVITNNRQVLIGVQVADCVPVLLYDPKKTAIGVVHAGWKGTASGLIKNTITAMHDSFGSSPEDIRVSIGPSIRWCCYKVKNDVLDPVIKATGAGEYHMIRDGEYCLDIASANKYQALSLGVLENNIWISDECTFCSPDKFYSYRYSKGHAGRRFDSMSRQGGFIGIF